MLDRRKSRSVELKKFHRGSKRLIAAAGVFVAGVAFVLAAFIFRDDEMQTPPAPAPRQITAHESSILENSAANTASKPKQDEIEPPKKITKFEERAENIENRAQLPIKMPEISKNRAALEDFLSIPRTNNAVSAGFENRRLHIPEIAYDAAASPQEILASQSKVYVVVSGDILGRIAQKNGCTIAQLQKANGLSNDQIKIGQKLLIPNCSGEGFNERALDKIAPAAENTAPGVQRGVWWKKKGVDSSVLPKLMAKEGFKPPQKFMALVVELTFDKTRQTVVQERAFDYKGTSAVNSGWNPASTVKIFAAIAALRRIDSLGFSARAKVTFYGKKTYATTVGELIEKAIVQSDNIAYNRVVQLASYENLHKTVLTSKFGITQTALNRAYQVSTWQSLGENPSLRHSPKILLVEGRKTLTLPEENAKTPAVCGSGACTSLQDLAESSRRLMLQEQLPPEETFNLKQQDLLFLRRAMRSAERTRGTEMVERFAAVFKDSRVKFYSKPGFSENWYTDNVYIFDPRHNQAWIVVMSGYPGRSSLNGAATAIAKIISSGKLREIP